MNTLFYISAAIAVVSAIMVIAQANVMRAVINLIVLLLAVAAVFYTLGAPFVAALQIVVYAGAIIVLFVFVVMILNLGKESETEERGWMKSVQWIIPIALAAVLLVQFAVTVFDAEPTQSALSIAPKAVGISLFTKYLIGVELASILLVAALVAAFHFAIIPVRREENDE